MAYRHVRIRVGAMAVGLWLLAVTVACSGGSSPAATTAPPRFEPAGAALQALVGTTFVGDLPAPLHDIAATARSAGASIVNAAADPAEADRVGMHWVVTADRGDFVVTEWAGLAEDGTPRWAVRSAWRLVLEPDMVVTFGTDVCEVPAGSFDEARGDFVAVTNEQQDRALGAWTITAAGPQVYTDLESLDCERFTP